MNLYQILMACGLACITGALIVYLATEILEQHAKDKEDAREQARWAPECEHSPSEDCMICAACGVCSETVNDEDICEHCL